MLVSEEGEPSSKWFHARGMRKFGRPDISVHGVIKNLEDGVIDLCNRLIEYQAAGYTNADRQPVRMASLPEGGVMRQRAA